MATRKYVGGAGAGFETSFAASLEAVFATSLEGVFAASLDDAGLSASVFFDVAGATGSGGVNLATADVFLEVAASPGDLKLATDVVGFTVTGADCFVPERARGFGATTAAFLGPRETDVVASVGAAGRGAGARGALISFA